MRRLKGIFEPITDSDIEIQGVSDLALAKRKFSGNAQYRRRHFLLFHGTFLHHFDISMIEKLLPIPSKQPAYRQNRSHSNFLTNLELPAQTIKEAMKQSWGAVDELKEIPFERIERLVQKQYSKDEWNLKF
jgi:lipoate-protein ligase A